MALTDPFEFYSAANDVEANLLRNMLLEHGIEAHVTDDNATADVFTFGALAEIHQPRVWIGRADSERAQPVLDEFAKNHGPHRDGVDTVVDLPVEMTCESCGQAITFPGDQRGTVQECPNCSAYLDVGGVDEEWAKLAEEESTDQIDE